MKKLIIKITAITLLLFPMMLSAQTSSIEDLYEKYVGEDGVTSVNISREMFRLMMAFDAGTSEDAKAAQDVIDNLNGLKILTYDARKGDEFSTFKAEVYDILKKKKFSELMTVQEEGQKIDFMIRKKGEDIIELLLIANENDDRELAIISFFGIIDLNAISKLSQSVQISGMENLRKMKKDLDND